MPPIALTPEQEELKSKIEEVLSHLLHWHTLSREHLEMSLDQLAEWAFQLHEQLKNEGQEPQHSPLLVFKRGKEPNSREFYRNMETAESLLAFISGKQ